MQLHLKRERFRDHKINNDQKLCSVDGCQSHRVPQSTSKYCSTHRRTARFYKHSLGRHVNTVVAVRSAKQFRETFQGSELVQYGLANIDKLLHGNLKGFVSTNNNNQYLLEELKHSYQYDTKEDIFDRVLAMSVVLLDNPNHPSVPFNSPYGIRPWLVYSFFDSKTKKPEQVSTRARTALIENFDRSLLKYFFNCYRFVKELREIDPSYFPKSAKDEKTFREKYKHIFQEMKDTNHVTKFEMESIR